MLDYKAVHSRTTRGKLLPEGSGTESALIRQNMRKRILGDASEIWKRALGPASSLPDGRKLCLNLTKECMQHGGGDLYVRSPRLRNCHAVRRYIPSPNDYN